MNITFHGAARAVTGSKHLITTTNGTQILLDCGLFQGMGEATEKLNDYFGFRPDKVDIVVLSHAHIDHCGLLPRLVAEGFKGPIYCTPATMDLSRILLMDSAKIHEQDAEFANAHANIDQPEILPLYTEDDVIKTMGQFKILEYGEKSEIAPGILLNLTDAGHILGSAAVHLNLTENGKTTKITFSGDIGRYNDLLLRSPQQFEQADYILLESTYGDSLHREQQAIEDQLLDIIHQTCVIRKGKVFIPAFSIGRTQEILFALNSLELAGKLPDIQYYVDSPLAAQATQVLKNHPEVYNNSVKEVMKSDDDIFSFKGLKFIESAAESKSLHDDPRPSVIIASSGMAEGGRIRHHIHRNVASAKHTILLVGYCDPYSLAGKLMTGQPTVRIFGEELQVAAQISSIKSMSAHGDYQDLLRFLSCQDPEQVKRIFLVHGEYEVQQQFTDKLREKGFQNIAIPAYHQQFELD